MSSTGNILPIQLIYTGTTPCNLPKYDFPVSFSVEFTKNHWSNTDKSIEHLLMFCMRMKFELANNFQDF